MPRLRRRQEREAAGGDLSAHLREAYEEVVYPGVAYPQTHPDRLATIATLFGGRPRAVGTARILELGCGDGGNLLPMAYALPGARFHGIDLSPSAIGAANATCERLGLENVRLDEADLAAIDPRDLGRFDYVIAHGVLSWVPDPVRDALLRLIAAVLERDGVAYVSFNALPGNHLRQTAREAMRFHARSATTVQERVARAQEIARVLAEEGGAAVLREEARRALARDEAGLVHDELADPSDAFLLTDVVGRAARHGLRHLADAELHEGLDGASPETLAMLDGLGPAERLEREQRLDLVRLTAFRRALLVREDARPGGAPEPGALPGLRIASPLRRTRQGRRGVVAYATPDGRSLETDHPPLQAVLDHLAEAWPGSVPFADLPGADQHSRALSGALLTAHLRGAVQLRTWEPDAAAHVPLRPRVAAPARLQAARGEQVTSLRDTSVQLADDLMRRLVSLCDGSRDLPALAEALSLDERGRHALRGRLEQLAALALLESS